MVNDSVELRGWSFSVDEVSAGVYKAVGWDVEGRRVEFVGFDPDALMERCKAAAREIIQQVTTPRSQCD